MKHRTLTLLLLLLLSTAAFVCPRLPASAAVAKPDPDPQGQRRRRTTRRRAPSSARAPQVDYSKFSHTIPQHHQAACDSCHTTPSANWAQVRERDAAFPDITDYPEHASCLNCHRRQFFTGARPAICSVCHTVVSPRAGARFPFENPKDSFDKSQKAKSRPSEFGLNFPHDLHQDVMARLLTPKTEGVDGVSFVRASLARQQAAANVDSCSICHQTYHQPSKPGAGNAATPAPAATPAAGFTYQDGMFKTTPVGHDSCFNCHWKDGGERPLASDCAGCHKLLPTGVAARPTVAKDADMQIAAKAGITDPFIIRKLLRRDSATFPHDDDNHKKIGCTSCHINISAISLLDERTIKVPILTCGGSGCHINQRPKKILNEEVEKRQADANFQCAKCHVNYGRQPIPKSHSDAVSK